jgi:hypothetical protein
MAEQRPNLLTLAILLRIEARLACPHESLHDAVLIHPVVLAV